MYLLKKKENEGVIMTIRKLINDKFGGCKKLAQMLGCKFPTTVYSWAQKNKIPAYRIYQVLDIAKQNNIVLTMDDFKEQ